MRSEALQGNHLTERCSSFAELVWYRNISKLSQKH